MACLAALSPRPGWRAQLSIWFNDTPTVTKAAETIVFLMVNKSRQTAPGDQQLPGLDQILASAILFHGLFRARMMMFIHSHYPWWCSVTSRKQSLSIRVSSAAVRSFMEMNISINVAIVHFQTIQTYWYNLIWFWFISTTVCRAQSCAITFEYCHTNMEQTLQYRTRRCPKYQERVYLWACVMMCAGSHVVFNIMGNWCLCKV